MGPEIEILKVKANNHLSFLDAFALRKKRDSLVHVQELEGGGGGGGEETNSR